MGRLVKCYLSSCQFGGKVDKAESVYFKNRNYHKECFEQYKILLNIRDLCFQIDPTIIIKTLNGYLYNLINEKNIDPDYILFTLEYIIQNNIDVNMPYGLIYRLNDYKVKNAYKGTYNTANTIKIHSS